MRDDAEATEAHHDSECVHAARVDLVLLSPLTMASLLDGLREDAMSRLGAVVPSDWPDADDRLLLKTRLQDLREDPAAQPWLLRAIVRRDPVAQMVGHVGFHGRPGRNGRALPGAVELGYAVFAAHRQQGYAREAVAALIEWASTTHGIRRFLASIAPGNELSAKVVTRLGFVEVGHRWDDEDGLELVFQLDLPDSGGSPNPEVA